MAKLSKEDVKRLYAEELDRRERNVVRVTECLGVQRGLLTKAEVNKVVGEMVKSEKPNVVKEAVLGLKKLKGMSAKEFNGGV